MTNFVKQKFIDVDQNELFSRASQWDIVQLKYDGHWCRLEFDSNGQGLGYTTSNRVETELICVAFANCVVIGEHMFGTNWAKQRGREGHIVLFDMPVCEGEDLSHKPYSHRWEKLSRRVQICDSERLFIAMTKQASVIPQVWDKFVLGVPAFEGVVLRKWNQPYTNELHRCKKDVEVTYVCVGFTEGQGRLAGRLGAILAGAVNPDDRPVGNVVCSVGGGFSDADRDYIWSHQSEFLGREFDAVGKQLFDTGALRHPNFVRWK